ncbi:response regulator [Prauserella alba]|uniref:Response regulator transcription factor n=1 Tax=Prauserella alba TaxID=176898 RepID=A0ABN1VFC6_9PSEU|nr:response regulator transcription factor [Prauserella alba]MCP2182219.1 two component transcriptional regulator, LuxR family [Prauserella alba]
MISAFIADDHELVRRGITDLLESDAEITVVGQAGTAAEALEEIRALRPDVAVLDVRLPDRNGIDVCRELRSELTEVCCLMLTAFSDEDAPLDAVEAGASGYALKDLNGQELTATVHTIANGRSLLDDSAARLIVARHAKARPADPVDSLSDREHTLLDLIGEGLTNRQISERMLLAEKTVKNYVSRLLAKLCVERRTQAAVLATRRHHG